MIKTDREEDRRQSILFGGVRLWLVKEVCFRILEAPILLPLSHGWTYTNQNDALEPWEDFLKMKLFGRDHPPGGHLS